MSFSVASQVNNTGTVQPCDNLAGYEWYWPVLDHNKSQQNRMMCIILVEMCIRTECTSFEFVGIDMYVLILYEKISNSV